MTIETLLIVAISAIALATSVIALILSGKAQNADEELVNRLRSAQANHEYMRLLEQQYQQAGAMMKAAIDLATTLVRTVAPLTPIKSDDEVARFLQDIQESETQKQE